jgi:hypothetical protein
MPRADVAARYAITLDATAEKAYAVARDLPMLSVPTARWLLWLRALPSRFDPRGSSEDASAYVLLQAEPRREVVRGMAGRFWHPSRNIIHLRGVEEWKQFAREGCAKAAINFRVEPLTDGRTQLSTETRVICFGQAARVKFKLYWLAAGSFSGLIRKEWLREVKRQISD